jgi:hypothetical protein
MAFKSSLAAGRRQFLPGGICGRRKMAAKQGFEAGAVLASDKAMPAYDFSMNKTGLALAQAASGSAAAQKNATADTGGFTLNTAFHDLLDIVNPLQHLPVVGTLYRAVTHDSIGTVEKIAGDTLYGGLWGAVGSVADTAFTALTGKDFGATMLSMVTGNGDSPKAVAAAAPSKAARTAAAAVPTQPSGADVAALSNSLLAKGVDGSLSARALFAYQQSQGLTPPPSADSLVAAN